MEASLLLTASRRKPNEVPVHLPNFRQGLAVVGEQVRVEQILVKLLTNAFEVQDLRTDPWVRLGISADVDCVTLTVIDNSPGLKPQVQLFAPFATSKPQGLGLGLVMPGDIPSDLGVDLTAEDPVQGQGATFRLLMRRLNERSGPPGRR